MHSSLRHVLQPKDRRDVLFPLNGMLGGCTLDPPREPIPPWECHKLFPPRKDNPAPPTDVFLPEPPEGVKGQQCKEADAAQVNSSEWRAGDTCFEWTFDH